ncbi:MAG TPA: lamin tail domain-containing protein [Solirubrobacteraceae bacterium]|nr:lamin tail domain-containing protein [Solirubrobacteraceae bacterium]
MRRLLLALLAAFTCLASALGAAEGAQAATKAPCIAGTAGPVCHFWTAKTVFVADGDTIRVVLDGDKRRKVKTIRFTGVNAMELSVYSSYPSRRRGSCMGLEATALVERYIKASRGVVRLSAQNPASSTGGRLRRTVEVRVAGRWQDLGRILMEAGYALWLPNGTEWARNREYNGLAQAAAAARKGLYDPAACAGAPSPEAQLAVDVNWDANGNDDKNLNGEWVDIRNLGTTDVPLGGWWLRDSWLRFGAPKIPGFVFPSYAVVPAGGSIRLYVGCGENGPANPGRFFWCQKEVVFENVTGKNDLGDGGYLFDPRGNLRSSMIYPCVASCVSALAGKVQITVHPTTPESISVTNVSGEQVDLAGNLLKLHLNGTASQFIWGYPFGAGSVLAPGESLTIHPDGSPAADTRLDRFLGLGPHRLTDGGNVVSLRSTTDVVVACSAWGRSHC